MNDDIRKIAKDYLNCPTFALTIPNENPISRNWFTFSSSAVQILAKHCLESVSISDLRKLLDETDFDTAHAALENLLDSLE